MHIRDHIAGLSRHPVVEAHPPGPIGAELVPELVLEVRVFVPHLIVVGKGALPLRLAPRIADPNKAQGLDLTNSVKFWKIC